MIKNITRKTVIAKNQSFLLKSLQQAKGLIFSKRNKGDKRNKEDKLNKVHEKALVFVFRKPRKVLLDMTLVFYPIDVIFLDENYDVVDMKRDFRPLTMYRSRKKAAYALELAHGSIGRTKTKIGDKVLLETGLEGAYA